MTKKLTTPIVVSALFAVALWAAGCAPSAAQEKPVSEAAKPKDKAMSQAPATSVEPVEAELAVFKNNKGEIVCPVQGDVIATPEKAFAHQDYEGMRYYFCCGGCPEEFAANPEKYAKK